MPRTTRMTTKNKFPVGSADKTTKKRDGQSTKDNKTG